PKPPPAPTLASALAGLPPTPDAVTLSVDAAQTTLPEGAMPPDAGATVEDIAKAYGRMAQKFGNVTAVAPPTMTLLNTDPYDPNIYLSMEQGNVFTLLAASLNDAQWQALTGTSGLGLSDLNSDDQRQLFTALFPGGKLVVQNSLVATPALINETFDAMASGDMDKVGMEFEARQKQSRRDLSDNLPQARVRLAQDVQISLSTAGKSGQMQPLDPEMMMNAPPHDEIVRDDQGQHKDELYGIPVRAVVPNALKAGDLDFDAKPFQAPIVLGGLRTVGDLVTRIGAQTRTELYADPRWERKALTFAPGGLSAPAGDLLRALTFCLTGTFRRVGPAYVLTPDTVGLGTILRRWADFEADAREKAAVPVAEAADRLFIARSPADLGPVGGALALSPAQEKGLNFDAAGSWDRNASQTVPFARLTPEQQQAARDFVALTTQLTARFKAMVAAHPEMAEGQSVPDPPMAGGDVSLETRRTVQLILPSENAPLTLLSLDLRTLFNPSNARREQLALPRPPRTNSKPVPPAAPPLKDVLATVPRRAVLAAPRTPAAVNALIAQMKTLGLNELWLDVFSDGNAHFTTGNATPNDVLAEALRATKDSPIRVLAVMDLFDWGLNAPENLRDRDILGETPAQAAAKQSRKNLSSVISPVSPFAPEVRGTLLSVVRALAERPGIAGLVWRGSVTSPGYAPETDPFMSDAPLGYIEPARLSFLRVSHADPMDISGPNYSRANLTLPGFDDDATATGLQARWDKARADALVGLLRTLRSAAAPTMQSGPLPFLYVNRRSVFS
ncbi:MAG: hypothetical protein M3Y28_09820, partial [Armatimonadota bacterium]|nr:hypothetical protein [Armatimonadota bacterium]